MYSTIYERLALEIDYVELARLVHLLPVKSEPSNIHLLDHNIILICK
jgi:hypothetical protein